MPKFTPVKPFSLYEPGTNYGNPNKASSLYSDLAKAHIEQGGVICEIYRYLGTPDQDRDALGVLVNDKGSTKGPTDIGSFLGIQDPIFGENRDRDYDYDEIPILRGSYQISQNELEYLRFGLALTNDLITMEFHAPTMELECGRRLIIGDVIRLRHLREVSNDGRVSDRWYEVSSITWSPGGYDPMYYRSILACILRPLRHQQEFLKLLNMRDEYGKTLAEQASNFEYLSKVDEAVHALASSHTPKTLQDTSIMWIDPRYPDSKPEMWTDDGKPDNGLPVLQGAEFPDNVPDGTWFLRTDLVPNRLYRLQSGKWKLKEKDTKREWNNYNWTATLREFMSDRSEEDRARKWELRSVHDVLTDRESRSDPTYDELTKKKLTEE